MEKYKKHIEGTSNIEFVHVSLDQEEDAAEEWAVKEQFPWLTVMPDKVERSTLNAYRTTNSVPEYHLVDGDGNTIVAGSPSGAEAFTKIDELAKQAVESDE